MTLLPSSSTARQSLGPVGFVLLSQLNTYIFSHQAQSNPASPSRIWFTPTAAGMENGLPSMMYRSPFVCPVLRMVLGTQVGVAG